MKTFLFIHGKSPELSKWEILSVFGDEVIFQNEWLSAVETERKVDQDLQNTLGGTIKTCEVFQGHPVDLIEKNAKTEKILFGLSQYGGHERLSDVLIALKKELKKRGKNARFINKDFKNISSGQLNKTHVLQKGIDLVRTFINGKEVWAKTIAFQDIDAYSKRDYERPKRDMKVGMMPPKLCQMMINFTQPGPQTTIYDPFCGLGTLLMEAILMGHPMLGSDIKGRMVGSSEKNIQWLQEVFQVDVPDLQNRLFQHDATQPFPSKRFPSDLVVVTEGYLGPPQERFPSSQKQKEIFDLLHGINSQFFSEVSDIIKPRKRLAMSFPYFKSRTENVWYPEDFLKAYEKNGFKMMNPLRSLTYDRQNQVVGREIILFQKCSSGE